MVNDPTRPRNIHALDLLQEELQRIMRLAGTSSIDAIGRDSVVVRS